MVTKFANEFRNYSNGMSDYAQLIQKCKPAYEEFYKNVKATAPDFRPYTLKEKKKYAGVFSTRFKDPEDESDAEDTSDEESEDDDEDDDSEEDDIEYVDGKSEAAPSSHKKKKPMYVDEVKKYIQSYVPSHLRSS